MRTLARAAALLALSAPAAVPATAQAAAPARGSVTERIVSSADTSQSYALYLPSAWTPGGRWPLLVLMDPRGRAPLPMERFRAAAERNGWIVASSYNTASDVDSALAINDRAVNAILADAQARYGADPGRLYFAGFSGTARYGWTLTQRLSGGVAGLIGVGGGFPQTSAVWVPMIQAMRPIPFFSAAGTTDFNLEEMTRLDSMLNATALPHRFARFEGGHEWLPTELAGRAVDWLQLQAISVGTAPRDSTWIGALYAASLARCQELEQRGDIYNAWAEYHAMVGDFLGLHDVSSAQARVQALVHNRAIRRERERMAADAERDDHFRMSLETLFDDVRRSRTGEPHRRLLDDLDLEKLQRQEADSAADRRAARSAARMLNTAYALSGYEAYTFMQAGRYGHAVAALRVARLARPRSAGVCWPLARALAQTHDRDSAIEALTCAVDGKVVPRAQIEREPMLQPLRDDPRFAALLSRAE